MISKTFLIPLLYLIPIISNPFADVWDDSNAKSSESIRSKSPPPCSNSTIINPRAAKYSTPEITRQAVCSTGRMPSIELFNQGFGDQESNDGQGFFCDISFNSSFVNGFTKIVE